MGYRSDVQGLIYGAEDEVTALLVAAKLRGLPDALMEHVKEVTFMSGDEEYHGLHLQWNYVKWYDDYPEIQAWYWLRDKAEERGLAYEFVRIGEELEDMERDERGDTIDVLYVPRSVHMAYDLVVKEG